MTDNRDVLDGLPTKRTCPFQPPTELARLRQEQPVARMTYPDGHEGWLVTSDELARFVLTDAAFSARQELRHPPVPMPAPPAPAPPGVFIGMDPPRHTRYRKPLNRSFTARRAREMEPAIARITEECLDAMDKHGSPADLLQVFALPLPVLVISELLGADRQVTDELQALRVPVLSPDTPPQQAMAAARRTNELMRALVTTKRVTPGPDLLSELIADGDLDDDELAGIAFLTLVAGHETTANMFALAIYHALENEPLRRSLTTDGPLPLVVVNELLRYLSAVQFVSRAALTDIELGGQQIRAGDSVTISLSSVNRDAARYEDPDVLEHSGRENSNLAFGHGLHQCIGANLARAELSIGIPALLRRFPDLRMNATAEEIPTRDAMNTFGVHRLPVAW